eukprot:gene27034-33694_t
MCIGPYSALATGRTVQSADLVFEKSSLVSRSILDDISTGVKLAFHPSADRVLLAVPMRGSVSFFLGKENWDEKILVSDPNGKHTHGDRELNLVAFSVDGKYLASADTSGYVLVWQLDLKDLTKSVPIQHIQSNEKGPLLDLHWGQEEGDNYLLLLTNDSAAKVEGVVSAPVARATPAVAAPKASTPQKKVVPVEIQSPVRDTASTLREIMSPEEDNEPVIVSRGAHKRLNHSSTRVREEDDDELLFEEFVPPKNLVTAGVASAVGVKNITASETSESIAEMKSASKPPKSVAKSHFDDEAQAGKVVKDDDEEDEDDGYDDGEDNDMDVEDKADVKGMSGVEFARVAAQSAVARQIKLQPAFQPASTRPDAQMRRYLAWNNVGSITSRDESIENRVEFRFTNTMGGNKNESFADRDTFVMAALAYEGAVFASEPEEDPDAHKVNRDKEGFKKPLPGSVIYYHAFNGQKQLDGVNESFRFTLADSEGAVAVAVGRGWIAVATTSKLLRIFSATGLQVKIVHLRGPVVTLVGMDSRLAIIYHSGVPLEETFQLGVDVLDINWREGCKIKVAVQGLFVPLSHKSTLTWTGFVVTKTNVIVSALLRRTGCLYCSLNPRPPKSASSELHQILQTQITSRTTILVRSNKRLKRLRSKRAEGFVCLGIYSVPPRSGKTKYRSLLSCSSQTLI